MLDLDELLQQSGALLKGHFLLTSGRHSDTYIEKFRILEQPKILGELCQGLANSFSSLSLSGPLFVAGPTTGGIIIAFEVARRMGIDAVYVESVEGVRTLRRGKTLPQGAKVFVVDDVLTTGKSIREVQGVIAGVGGIVAAVGVLIDRSESELDFGCPLFASHRVPAASYAADEVPSWLSAVPISKPGTSVAN